MKGQPQSPLGRHSVTRRTGTSGSLAQTDGWTLVGVVALCLVVAASVFAAIGPSPKAQALSQEVAGTALVTEATPSVAIALGASIDDAPDHPSTLTAYTTLVGRAPAIVSWYQSWSEPLFYSGQMPPVAAMGAAPMITWDPIVDGHGIPLKDIASGREDGIIRAAALEAKGWGHLILVRFAHEMNLFGSTYGPSANHNTSEQFVAAWRHVVDLFRQLGATNVRWVWSPNVDCGGSCPFTAFYPGDAWVDWVALDGYNYAGVDHVQWLTFDQIFRSSYDTLAALTDKPMMIGETASAETGGDKAQWITTGLLRTVPTSMPRIRALVWFDRLKETDWRVNSSASSLAAFREVVASPLYQGSVLRSP